MISVFKKPPHAKTNSTREDRLEILLDYLGLEIAQESNGRFHFLISKSKTAAELAEAKKMSVRAIYAHITKSKDLILNSLTSQDSKIYFNQLFEIYSEDKN